MFNSATLLEPWWQMMEKMFLKNMLFCMEQGRKVQQ
jgi:hypothetical protein